MKKIIKFCQENNLIFSINTNAMNGIYVIFDFVDYNHRQNRHFVTISTEDLKHMCNSKIENHILTQLSRYFKKEDTGDKKDGAKSK